MKKTNWTAICGCIALLLLVPASVLMLVPSSSAKIVDFFQPLYEVDDPYTQFCLTRYGLGAAISAFSGLVLTLVCAHRHSLSRRCLLCVWGAVGALLGARLLYIGARFSYILADLGGASFFWQFWQGGYTLYGGLLGGMVAIAIYAHVTQQKLLPLLDDATPGALLTLLGLRLSEAFSGQGTSKLVEDIGLSFLPFQKIGEYDTVLCVWAYEAIVAAIALLAVLVMRRRFQAQGRMLETGLTVVSIAQVMLDSWRADELIRFGFVRLNMLMAAGVLVIILSTRLARLIRQGASKGLCIARAVTFLAGAGICIAIEFALDKSPIDNGLLYLVMTAVLVLMLIAILLSDGRTAATKERN